jgi:Ni/Fe-hydrogenase subunit HybB-like protein
MQIMAVAIVPVAVSVHTIVSFDFSMTSVPMWHSTIFGPYFVAGAIFSGIAALIIAMATLRWALRLQEYLRPVHFDNLGKLLLTMSLLWGYFTFNERLTSLSVAPSPHFSGRWSCAISWGRLRSWVAGHGGQSPAVWSRRSRSPSECGSSAS